MDRILERVIKRYAVSTTAELGKSAPKKVDDLFKEVKNGNPSYSDEQAWATAWSIYCKHVDPSSDHCKKPNDYLPKQAAFRETDIIAKEFPSEDALNKYLKEHPKADRSKHKVKKSPSSDQPKTQEDPLKKQWGEALEAQLGRKPTEEDFVILRGKLTQYVKNEENKNKSVFDKGEDAPKADPKDPFVQQWGEALEAQLGRKPTKEDVDIAKGKMMQFVQNQRKKEAATSTMILRVAARCMSLVGTDLGVQKKASNLDPWGTGLEKWATSFLKEVASMFLRKVSQGKQHSDSFGSFVQWKTLEVRGRYGEQDVRLTAGVKIDIIADGGIKVNAGWHNLQDRTKGALLIDVIKSSDNPDAYLHKIGMALDKNFP